MSNGSPLAVRLPWCSAPYHEAMPISAARAGGHPTVRAGGASGGQQRPCRDDEGGQAAADTPRPSSVRRHWHGHSRRRHPLRQHAVAAGGDDYRSDVLTKCCARAMRRGVPARLVAGRGFTYMAIQAMDGGATMTELTRRGLVIASASLAASLAAWLVVGPAYAALAPTPGTTEGPFYPLRIPDDHDSDLVRVEAAVREAGGEILHLAGTVGDTAAQPLAGATVEIWQCDAGGVYLHPRDRRYARRDAAFQGFGRTVADRRGRFAFRTILPVPYPGRTPHIHARILAGGRVLLTTQLYRAGFPQNASDFLYSRLTPAEQARAAMEITPRPSAGRPEWQAVVRLVVPA
jgi:protocatechuate 3,4-dioxygenase beta subunit